MARILKPTYIEDSGDPIVGAMSPLVVRGDGSGLMAALSQEPWPGDSLQLIGEGLLGAVRNAPMDRLS